MKINTNFFADFAKSKYATALPALKQKKSQEITTIVLTFVTLSLFAIFAINPTLSTIAQLQRELEDKQEVYRKLEEKIKNIALLQQQYDTMQSSITLVTDAIPHTPEASELTAQLQQLGKNNSIVINRSQIFEVDIPNKKAATKDLQQSFAFSLTAEGSYTNMTQFLTDLVSFDRIITIENIALTNGPEGSNKVQANLRGRAYFKQ